MRRNINKNVNNGYSGTTLKLSPAYPCGKLCLEGEIGMESIERKCLYIYKCNKLCEKNKVLQEEKNGKLISIARLERLSEEVTFEWRSESTRSSMVGRSF